MPRPRASWLAITASTMSGARNASEIHRADRFFRAIVLAGKRCNVRNLAAGKLIEPQAGPERCPPGFGNGFPTSGALHVGATLTIRESDDGACWLVSSTKSSWSRIEGLGVRRARSCRSVLPQMQRVRDQKLLFCRLVAFGCGSLAFDRDMLGMDRHPRDERTDVPGTGFETPARVFTLSGNRLASASTTICSISPAGTRETEPALSFWPWPNTQD